MRLEKQAHELHFSALLKQAVSEPGKLKEVYNLNFWHYSFGNCLLASMECWARGITLGPIATYKGWLDKGRQVRKGEKAITLCMPVTGKKREGEEDEFFTRFVYRNNWFVLSQTEGEEYHIEETPIWNKQKALETLKIEETEFSSTMGEIGGYAVENRLSINPLNNNPTSTLYHEMAHIVLGHTGPNRKTENLPHTIKELEAECTALFCLESLGLSGSEYCRGYIQAYIEKGGSISEKMARRIFKATDSILRAGVGTK